MQQYIPIINRLIVGIIFIIIAILALARVDKYLKQQGIIACSKVSITETTQDEGKTKISYPVVALYQECLTKIGVK